METGTISKWELAEGESFSAGSVICSIETDKATMDFEAQDDGVLAKILKDGSDAVDLSIGSPIAIIVEEPEDVAAFANYVLAEEAVEVGASEPVAKDAPVPTSATSSSEPAAVLGGSSGMSMLLPSARFLAESRYVDRVKF